MHITHQSVVRRLLTLRDILKLLELLCCFIVKIGLTLGLKCVTCSSFLERGSGGERPAADAENVRVVVVDDFFSDDGVVNEDSVVVLLLLLTPFS